MFGRHEGHAGGETEVPVDATLERDIVQVERSVAAYLEHPSDASRQSLLEALQRLDDQTDRADAYGSSVVGSGAVGYASRGEILGETSIDPVVHEVPGAELRAQVALVNAAKDEVRRPGPDTRATLRSARTALAATRNQGAAGR